MKRLCFLWHRLRAFKAAAAAGTAAMPIYYLSGGGKSLCSFSLFTKGRDEDERLPIYGWGSNEHGLLQPCSEEKDTVYLKIPTRLDMQIGQGRLRAVSAARTHIAAVDSRGDLYQWGSATANMADNDARPQRTLGGQNIQQVCCTEDAVFALADSGTIYHLPMRQPDASSTATINTSGEKGWFAKLPFFKGVLSASNRQEPSTVSIATGNRPIQIAAGHDHLVALTDGGQVFTGALNTNGNLLGQLGRGEQGTKPLHSRLTPAHKPEFLKYLRDLTSAPSDLSEEALIECKSIQSEGPVKNLETVILEKVDDDSWRGQKITKVACGAHHTLLLSDDGRAFGFGSNEMLQLALGPYDHSRALLPRPIELRAFWPSSLRPAHTRIAAIAASSTASYFVMEEPARTTIYAAGEGQFGQLGNGSWTHVQGSPVKVSSLSGLGQFDEKERKIMPIRPSSLAAGSDHVAVVMSTFTLSEDAGEKPPVGFDLYLWGANKCYQLGTGKKNNASVPVSPNATNDALAIDQSNAIASNKEKTIVITNGIFQLLPSADLSLPAHRVYCGPEVTILY